MNPEEVTNLGNGEESGTENPDPDKNSVNEAEEGNNDNNDYIQTEGINPRVIQTAEELQQYIGGF